MTTIRPVLKRLHSPDVFDLESFCPADPSCFGFLLQAMYGPEGGEGEESFDIVVCTPTWLSAQVERQWILDGRHHLIVSSFDLARMRTFLEQYANACAASTWGEAALKLSRLGKWEFEDYDPRPSSDGLREGIAELKKLERHQQQPYGTVFLEISGPKKTGTSGRG